jgi:hypothetical protein
MTISTVFLVVSSLYWLIIVALLRKKILLLREIRQLREKLKLYDSFVELSGLTQKQVLEAAQITGDQFWKVRASCAKLGKSLAEFEELKRLTDPAHGHPWEDQP